MANLDPYDTDVLSSGIDLQQEMVDFIDGSLSEASKGRLVLLRRMRKDSGGNLVQCPCVDDKTKEPDLDNLCPYCLGAKYYWDEELHKSYWHNAPNDEELQVPFLTTGDRFSFYFKYGVKPALEDEIVTVNLNSNGKVIYPVERKSLYKIVAIREFREDHGRLVFFRATALLDTRRYIER